MNEIFMKGGGDKIHYRHNFRNNPIDVKLGRDGPCLDQKQTVTEVIYVM